MKNDQHGFVPNYWITLEEIQEQDRAYSARLASNMKVLAAFVTFLFLLVSVTAVIYGGFSKLEDARQITRQLH